MTWTTPMAPLRHRVRDFVALGKPRITLMAVLATAAGFWLGTPGSGLDPATLVGVLLGAGLAAAGAGALNMYMEHRTDARMVRTAGRPIPAGRVRPAEALAFGLALAGTGVLLLVLGGFYLAAAVTAFTVAAYLLAYTPLKPVTSLSILVGAVPGAAPPMIGWAAARGDLSGGAWVLFAVLFAWQLPHVLAIGWMHREDYARAGWPILAGRAAAPRMALFGVALLAVSLAPVLFGTVATPWGVMAAVAGVGFTATALGFSLRPTRRWARRVFLASLVYLPCVLAFLALGKPVT